MKKIAMLLADGFEEIEALLVVDVLRRANFVCDLISVDNKEIVRGSHQIKIVVDKNLNDLVENYDMVILPGGMPGTLNLKENKLVIELVQKYAENDQKYVAAICAAPIVLAEAGVITGIDVTSYPDEEYKKVMNTGNYLESSVVIDRQIITSRGAGTAFEFAYALVDILGGDSQLLKESMVYHQEQ